MTKILSVSILSALFATSAFAGAYVDVIDGKTGENVNVSPIEKLHATEDLREFSDLLNDRQRPSKDSFNFVLKSDIDGKNIATLLLRSQLINGKVIQCHAHVDKNEVLESGIHTLKVNPSKMGSGKAVVLKLSTYDKEMKSKVICTAKPENSLNEKPASNIAITQSELETYFSAAIETENEAALKTFESALSKGSGMHLWENSKIDFSKKYYDAEGVHSDSKKSAAKKANAQK